jgi:5-methyltetrahydropteroyltriglutamate--homocysteine methyltransferase
VNGPYDLLRVDQVGSLLRPGPLQDAYSRADRGELGDLSLRRVAREAVRDVIAEQERRGVQPISDGEFWRRSFQETFGNAVSGYAPEPFTAPGEGADARGQVSEAAYVRRRAAVRRLRLVRNLLLDEYRADREFTDGPLKVTLIGPERLTQRFDLEQSSSVYESFEIFMADVVAIEREMLGAVVEAGCRYLQIDEPAFTAYVDPTSLEWMRDRGWAPAAALRRGIAADNALIEGFTGATFGLHICRGNAAGGRWHREGAYDAIAEELFAELRYPRLLLEYDTERAGGFEPLRFVPKGVVVVLGLISTKSPQIEDRDMILRRIEEAAAFLPIEQLALRDGLELTPRRVGPALRGPSPGGTGTCRPAPAVASVGMCW